MRWHEITVHTTEEAIEIISNFIHELGAGGVSIEESGTLNKQRDTSFGQLYDQPLNDIPEGKAEIKGYFAEERDIKDIVTSLEDSIEKLSELGIDIDLEGTAISANIVDEQDWANAWKKYFKPLQISETMTIKPTWEDYHAREGEIVIELDPGMAFGTGTHVTTSLCLEMLEKIVKGQEDVIDVGAGSGILSIAAAKLGARHVLALDLDPVAVSIALENNKLNGLEAQITVQQSDLLQLLKENGMDRQGLGVSLPVQLIVSNILAEVIISFVDDVYEALEHGGCFIASGIIVKKQEEVEQALQRAKLTITDRVQKLDWVALVARKL